MVCTYGNILQLGLKIESIKHTGTVLDAKRSKMEPERHSCSFFPSEKVENGSPKSILEPDYILGFNVNDTNERVQ